MTHSKNNNFKKGQKVNKLDCLSSLITLLHLLEEKKNTFNRAFLTLSTLIYQKKFLTMQFSTFTKS